MTEEVDNYFDLEQFPNKMDKAEEDADKFNDLTFNSELPWEYDEVGIDNDGHLKAFEFDNFDDENDHDLDSRLENDDKASSDLLGLTGSLINFRIFKSHNNSENNLLKDAEFETAFNKLNLVDQSVNRSTEENFPPLPTLSNEKLIETHVPLSNPPVESPFNQLTKFSDFLYNEFQQYQKSEANLHVLNQLVSNHLNMLSKQLQLLNLPMDILPQLRYFKILMNFVAIDNKLTEIQTKFANNPVQLNLEIAQIIHHFTLQAPKQQLELCGTHPFYSNLMSMVAFQNQQVRFAGPKNSPLPLSPLPEWVSDEDRHKQEAHQARCRQFLESEGGWLSESERDWLIKVQTRNLTTDNPYVHDYYFTRLKLNQLTEERRLEILTCGNTSIADPLSQLPSPITAEQLGVTVDPGATGSNQNTRAAGPIHFEKSLGVLSPSNLNAPRQIIQLRRSDLSGKKSASSSTQSSPSSQSSSSYRAVRAQRELLGLIEKMYSIVLRVDEVDKSLARMLVEQHRSRGVLVQHRNYLLRLLSDCIVTDNARFVELLSVAKGARVVVATVAIVTATQFVQVLRTVFFNCISVCESRFFPDIEVELRSIVCSRVRNLRSEELTVLISAFYSNVTPNSLDDKLKLQPLSGFCSNEFGLTIILTVLDTFLKTNPNDKAHVTHLLSITIKSSESQSLLLKCMKDFKYLFPTTDRH